MNKLEILGYVSIAALLLGPVVMRAVASVAQPSRRDLADIGRELLSEDDLPADIRNLVQSMTKDAFNPWIVPALCGALPIFLVLKALGKVPPVPGLEGSRFSVKLEKFTDLHVRSIFAANPFCAVILILELVPLAPIFIICSLLGRSARYASPVRMLDSAIMNTELVFSSRRLSRLGA